VTETQYTVLGLEFGKTYQFRVQAINSHGYSDYSEVLQLLCAHVPAKPATPVTNTVNENVVVSWYEPSAHGSPILSYQVFIRKKDGTFHFADADCDGSTAEALSNFLCSIPLTTLIEAPYSLTLLNSVYAKIVATNYYGDSEESLSGNGAKIFLVPDAPVNLQKNPNFLSSQS
jgi:hypothetical protein